MTADLQLLLILSLMVLHHALFFSAKMFRVSSPLLIVKVSLHSNPIVSVNPQFLNVGTTVVVVIVLIFLSSISIAFGSI